MPHTRRAYYLLVLSLWSLFLSNIHSSFAGEESAKLPTQVAKLTHGVNIFYTVTEEGGQLVHVDDAINQVTEEDALRIKQAGLNHVRFAVSPYPLMHDDRFDEKLWQGENARHYLRRLHEIIELFIAHDVVVVLAVMPNEQSFERLHRAPEYIDEWARFFHAWGREFSQHPSSMLMFETLNEPRFALFLSRDSGIPADADSRYPVSLLEQANARWIAVENRLLGAIRSNAPAHTLVVTADGFSDPMALALRFPSPYPNVIYGFHYYYPLMFTHQNARWFDLPGSYVEGLAYPSQEANCNMVQAASRPEDREAIGHYCRSGWNVERHRKELAIVRDWSKRHGVQVWAGEFGTYPLKIDADSMKRYYRDIQAISDEYGFGWCAWEYTNWLGRFEKLKLTEIPAQPGQ